MKTFEDVFGGPPAAVADAPGRVNLLGEHTDYNEGYVLPIAIAQRTRVAMRPSAQRVNTLHAATLSRSVQFSLDAPPADHYATYVYGCLREAKAQGIELSSLDIHVWSEVPIGVGLSSSAALEVATLRALRNLLRAPFDDVLIAKMAQRAEIEHAGVRCGIMDQMASSLADTSRALFLDTRTLERALVRCRRAAPCWCSIRASLDRSPQAATTNVARSARQLRGASNCRHCATSWTSPSSTCCRSRYVDARGMSTQKTAAY